MKNIKLVAMQCRVFESKADNLAQLKQNMSETVVERADLVTLPEMFNCPYKTDLFPKYAEPEGGETWQLCAELARKNKVYLSAGSIPEVDENGNIYNTAYVFDRTGSMIAKHRKMHLFDIDVSGGQHFKESDTLSGGSQVTVFDTEFCRMGLCICYDFRFPELAGLMSNMGAKIMLVPAAFNLTTGPAHWESMFRQRAVDNQVFAIGTAPARDENGCYISWGHSIVADPWGTVRAQLNEKPGFLSITVDIDMVDKVRNELPLIKHKRVDVYKLVQL